LPLKSQFQIWNAFWLRPWPGLVSPRLCPGVSQVGNPGF